MSRLQATKLFALRKVLLFIEHFNRREQICSTKKKNTRTNSKNLASSTALGPDETIFSPIDFLRVKCLLDRLFVKYAEKKWDIKDQNQVDRLAFACLYISNKLDNDLCRYGVQLACVDHSNLFKNSVDFNKAQIRVLMLLDYNLFYDQADRNKELCIGGMSGSIAFDKFDDTDHDGVFWDLENFDKLSEQYLVSRRCRQWGFDKFEEISAKFAVNNKIKEFVKESDLLLHEVTKKQLAEIEEEYKKQEQNETRKRAIGGSVKLEGEEAVKKQKT